MVRVGLIELAFGAMTGWVIVLVVSGSPLLTRIGIHHPRRLLQAHLDYILMGLILIAVGLAAPDLPAWITLVIMVGTWLNPTLFLPMAFSDQVTRNAAFRGLSVLSFVATSGGLVLAAAVG